MKIVLLLLFMILPNGLCAMSNEQGARYLDISTKMVRSGKKSYQVVVPLNCFSLAEDSILYYHLKCAACSLVNKEIEYPRNSGLQHDEMVYKARQHYLSRHVEQGKLLDGMKSDEQQVEVGKYIFMTDINAPITTRRVNRTMI